MNKIKEINESSYKFATYITGGGTSFIPKFLSQTGGSSSVIFADVPYNQKRFNQIIEGEPDKYVSDDAANKLATKAYLEAVEITDCNQTTIGVGVSAALTKEQNERSGRKNLAYISLVIGNYLYSYKVEITGVSSRVTQDELIAQNILNLLYFYTIDSEVEAPAGTKLEKLYESSVIEPIHKVYRRQSNLSLIDRREEYPSELERLVVFAGSFNLCHAAHLSIFEKAKEVLGQQPILEISVFNIQKPLVDYKDLNERIQDIEFGFVGLEPSIAVVNKSKFVDKAELYWQEIGYSELVFVVGQDTWNKISYSQLEELHRKNVKFLVFGRNNEKLPEKYDDPLVEECLIRDKEAQDFDYNISSSYLRKNV